MMWHRYLLLMLTDLLSKGNDYAIAKLVLDVFKIPYFMAKGSSLFSNIEWDGCKLPLEYRVFSQLDTDCI